MHDDIPNKEELKQREILRKQLLEVGKEYRMKVVVTQLLVCFLFVIWFVWVDAAAEGIEASTMPIAKPDCREKCGNVSVPYPFGMDDPGCFMNENFQLKCEYDDNAAAGSSPKLMIGNIQIQNINVEQGTAMVYLFMAYNCYNKSSDKFEYYAHRVTLTTGPFTFSARENKFTAVGCNTVAYVSDSQGTRFGSGCISLCHQPVNLTREGSCSGVGCCQTQIPSGLKTLNMSIETVNNDDNFSPCSYAFLAYQSWLGFSSINLMDTTKEHQESPAVLDWVVGSEETCESVANKSSSSSTTYACGPNTNCSNSINGGPGYRCVCKPGYHGNPYLPQGCQDIDECVDPKTYACEGSCRNTPGNYTCRCPLGMYGDGKVACKGFRFATFATACGAGIFVVVIILFLWRECRRRRKTRNFQKNGGLLLKHQKIRIFGAAELERATLNYSVDRLLGRGGSASVYKGVLEDESLVAVKKPNDVNFPQTKQLNQQFQHEIDIVSQVNHRNVVKLLGLCLETKVPLLVYELVSNGSLFDHLHVKRSSSILNSWTSRLRIASDTSLALDYLHSLADPPIIHRDVKSMNILLADEKFTAKVSDFGASVLIPLDQSGVDTKVQGTRGYLDPEYLITGKLTPKSDVYSFGVVLMELLTGEMPNSNQMCGEKENYIQYFIYSVEQKRFSQVLIVGDEEYPKETEQMETVAELARRCLSRSGRDRPNMKEVAEQLLGLKKIQENFQAQQNDEETQSLLGPQQPLPIDSSLEAIYMTACDIELTSPGV